MSLFELVENRAAPTLRANVTHYRHKASGARHIHVACDDTELAFLVGFPTLPDVGDGRAHILEHLALSGSKRYPVAAPFFSMMRRSTATFMNAMTYADRTAYPFASTDRTDFLNLLDVFLDATFFPKLDYLSFRQEGWRHTLKDGKLGMQGVVFNEMKGAYGDPMQALHLALMRELFASTTYAVDSGGDPLLIPNLTHDDLRTFHANHYNPAQAVFMSWGCIDPSVIQERIVQRVLEALPGSASPRLPQFAKPFPAPRSAEIAIPSQGVDPNQHGVQIAWLLDGSGDDMSLQLRAQMLARGLMGDASAPLMRAMQAAGFGRPSRTCGLDNNTRQLVLHVGMAGLSEAEVPEAQRCIRDALERVALDSIPAAALHAIVRDMKYGQREVGGGQMPAGVSRLLEALPLALRQGDVIGAFDIDPLVQTLEKDLATPGFFQGMVRALLDTPTCLTAHIHPDPQFFVNRSAREDGLLAERQRVLSEVERQHILSDETALAAHQSRRQDNSVLPRILPSDLSRQPRQLPKLQETSTGHWVADVRSNGISYASVVHDVSTIGVDQWPWLKLYAQLLPELGSAGRGYDAASAWRQSQVPSFYIQLESFATLSGALKLQMVHGASALFEDQRTIAPVMAAWLATPRFDEHERIAFLIQSLVRDQFANLGPQGGRMAILSATAPLSVKHQFDERVHGASAVAFSETLLKQSQSATGLQDIAARLETIHTLIVACPRAVVCATTPGDGVPLAQAIADALPVAASSLALVGGNVDATRPGTHAMANVALHIPGQVNHCVAAWPVPSLHHVHAPALAVAASLLTNQVLHQALREQGGAYGASAGYSAESGLFTMSTMRDPRLAGTFADFATAVKRGQHDPFSQEALDEAIVSVIKQLDKPDAPQAEAWSAWLLLNRRVNPQDRQDYRTGVLQCTLQDVRSVVQQYLLPNQPSRAAAAGNLEQDLAGLTGVEVLTQAAKSA